MSTVQDVKNDIAMTENELPERVRLWSLRDYRWWFASDTASIAGYAMRSVVIPLIAFALSGSIVYAGVLGTIVAVIQQVASFFGGTVIDRNNRCVLVIANAVVGTVGWAVIGVLLVLSRLPLGLFVGMLCVLALVNGLLSRTTDAMLRSVVPMQEYAKAQGINQGRDATVSLAASPVGAFLYSLTSALPFLGMALFYAVSGACIMPLRKVERKRMTELRAGREQVEGAEGGSSFWRDLAEGWKWVLGKKTLVTLMVVGALFNLSCSGMLYASQLFMVNERMTPVKIGYLDTAVGVVTLVGALIATRYADLFPVGKTLIAGIALYLACTVWLIFTTQYWALLVCGSLCFLLFPLFNAQDMGLICAKTPIDLQGRVLAAISVPVQCLSMFASAISGSLVSAIGFGGSMVIYSVIAAIAMGILMVLPGLRNLPASDKWEEVEL